MKRRGMAGTGAVCAGLTGCARNPNVEIVGSYFPGWMICFAFGVLLTGAAHVALRRFGLLSRTGPPALFYSSLLVLSTCACWLCLFA